MMLRSDKIWCRHFYLPHQKVTNNNQIPNKAEFTDTAFRAGRKGWQDYGSCTVAYLFFLP